MTLIDSYSVPGMTNVLTATQRKLLRGYPSQLILLGIRIVSTAADAGNTPTTELRTGLVMGQVTATGLYKQYSPSATDGSQFPAGILWEERNTLDATGTARDVTAQLVVAGFVVASSVINLDPRVRAALPEIMFDDAIPQPTYFAPIAKTANYTLVAADSGKSFTNTGAAGAVTFTLPTTIPAGFNVEINVTADQNVIVAAPAGKMITFNNAAATSVAFQTAGNKIGGSFRIKANEDATKYIAMPSGANTLTVA